MELVTIITPTYNRGKELKRLYQSLINQESYNFRWLIIDDGSVDDTENIVKVFKENASFNVEYIKKQNQGKHTALNRGIKEIKTVLTFIVDSDDLLLPCAVRIIEDYYNKYKSNKKLGAFSFLRCKQDGTSIIQAPREEFVGSYLQCRIKDNLAGDMAEVFYTEVLKEFPFPEFEGEKFLSEDVVWIRVGKNYDYLFVNKAIYQCEYLEGGLTANDKPMKFASPLGSMMRGKMLMSKGCGYKANIKGAIIYNCYKCNVKVRIPQELKVEGLINNLLIILTYPLGILFNRKWRG